MEEEDARQREHARVQRHVIGQRIQARREYLGISRADMGRLLGISEKGYGHLETGHAEITATKFPKIAEHLGVAVGYFFGEDEDQDADMDQEDRDTIRYLNGMPPQLRAGARAAVKAMHDANAREQTTHGKKAE